MVPSSYLKIARDAIKARLDGVQINQNSFLSTDTDLLCKKATFITLTLHGQLRGCIGSLIPHRNLLDDLIANAESAAFNDPRFTPLTAEELDAVKIEVSLLSEPKKVIYTDRNELKSLIHIGRDGVILRLGSYQATFLPQVWEELPDFDTFFTHLGMKAGVGSDPLSYHPEIYTYQVDKIKES
ncbi:AmmeMemoRadiSam system protein A [Sulfuricurvum sp.]|uniref:AmmeMemoRadiSam system protein A n=1 Tax=Sulfuricurvum sp. TaxID=2025608 RepID=UPI003563F897